MKAAAIMAILVASLAGAVTHRVAMSSEMKSPVAQRPAEVRRTEASPSAIDLTDVYFREEDDVLKEQMLASLTAEQFPLIAEEMIKRHKSLDELLPFWVRTDVTGLLSFMGRHPRDDVYWHVIGECFRAEPEGTLSAIERFKSAGLKVEEVERLFDRAFENIGDPLAAIQAAQKHGLISERDHLYRLNSMVTALGNKDPKAAVAFAEKYPRVFHTALNVWSLKEPEAVMNWMRERLGKQIDSITADSVLGYMAEHYPESVEQYLAMAENKSEVYRGLASGFKEKPIEDLTSWLESLPEDGRSAAYEQLCSDLQRDTTGKLAALCMTFPELATTGNSGNTGDLIVEWAKQNPVGALQDFKAGKIPPAVADKILPQMVESLFLVDRPAAMAFIQSQPNSETKGVLLLQASRLLDDGDRQSALDYALHLPEEAARLGACRRILGENYFDGTKEEQLALISSIPDEAIRQALLKPVETKSDADPAQDFTSPPKQEPFSDPFAPGK